MAQSWFDEIAHLARFGTTLTVGKGLVMQTEKFAAGAAAGMGGTMFGLVVMPLVVGVSAVLAQLEHQHYRDKLREEFKNEIAAKTGKAPEQVVDVDLDVVAAANKGLARSLRNSAKDRNNMIILSVISSVVSMAAVKFLSGIGLPLDGLDDTIAGAAVKVMAGVGTYLAVKKPLHWLVDTVNGLDDPTVADKAATLSRAHHRGVTISQEKVFELYLDANPELGQSIKREYGKDYEKMNRRLRAVVLRDYGPMLDLEKTTADINAGRVNPTELAFAAYGDASGVQPREKAHEHFEDDSKQHWAMRLVNFMGGRLTTLQHQKRADLRGEKMVEDVIVAPLLEPTTPKEALEERKEEQLHKSFAERVGRKRSADLPASHVERLAMQQAETAAPTQSL